MRKSSIMSANLVILLTTAALFQYAHGSEDHAGSTVEVQDQTPPQMPDKSYFDPRPLFLTPYIDNCTYYEAREKSKIPYFLRAGVTAYSGYITVNKTSDSNLFFLMTEVKGNSSSAPLLLWTQGGPGLSALFGLFLENGPFAFDIFPNRTPNVFPRVNTLQNDMSVLYLDLPVGAGFSFTNDAKDGYPKTLEDIVAHVMEFLAQFLKVFSEYEGRDFYLAGESYGARYSVAIASWMLKNPDNVSLKLKGVIGGNGFLGPIFHVADSTEFLYQTSMLDKNGRQTFGSKFQQLRYFSESKNETLQMYALQQLFETIFTKQNGTPTLFQNLTLYNDHASPLTTERPFFMLACYLFLSTSTTKIMLHAGLNTTFQIYNPLLLSSFAPDWLRDISAMNEHVLNETGVLFYTGQIDALFPSVNQRAYFKLLNWTYADEYRTAPRSPWIPHQAYYGFGGYITRVKNFTDAVLLGMSHYGAIDRPDEAYYLMTGFVKNLSNVDTAATASETGASS